MGILSGTHDPRTFRHFAQLAADGSVVAVVEVADGAADPVDGFNRLYVEVTDLHPYDFSGVRVKAKAISDRDLSAVKAELTAKDRGRREKTERGG